MNEIEETINARRNRVRRRNKTAAAQAVVTSVIILFLVIHIVSAGFLGASLFDVIQVIVATATLAFIWFYKSTEKERLENVASGLAGDLLIGIATRMVRTPIIEPLNSQEAMMGTGRLARTVISISTRQSGILEVANRVAQHRIANQNGFSISDGRIPRISSIAKEYEFTAYDVQAITASMKQDHERVAIYKTILDLIQASQ